MNEGELHEASAAIGRLEGLVTGLTERIKARDQRDVEHKNKLWDEIRGIGNRLAGIEASVKSVPEHESRLKKIEDGHNQRLGRASVLSALGGGGTVALFDWLRAKLGI